VHTLLAGALEARGRVLLKLNVSEEAFERVIAIVPSMKSPTISKLFGNDGYAIETVVAKDTINVLIPMLKDAGATDLIELPISKIVH
jgi:ATP phosphoribosyltransferase